MKQAQQYTYDAPTAFDSLSESKQRTLEAIAIDRAVAVEDRGGLQLTNSGADYFEVSATSLRAMLAEAYAAGQASKA